MVCAAVLPTARAEDETGLALAERFAASGEPAAAALEYRRMAVECDDDAEAAQLLLKAAEAYAAAGDAAREAKMLDQSEERDPAPSLARTLLRADAAERERDWLSAALWAEEAVTAGAADARGAAAADYLLGGDAAGARRMAADDESRLRAIDAWEARGRKRPWLGGLLGIVPGMGYAYSGEWGNALRSIFLNGLFIWAMVETADEEQWALFAVSTFFEATWWTGSIYGGLDSAHRWNKRSLNDTAEILRGGPAGRD
jgi:hypothetical protein